MTSDFALAISGDMLWTALMIGAPILGISMLVGLLVSIIQVVTQIQEVSLTFIPKVLAAVFTLLILGPWMLGKLLHFATTTIGNIPNYF